MTRLIKGMVPTDPLADPSLRIRVRMLIVLGASVVAVAASLIGSLGPAAVIWTVPAIVLAHFLLPDRASDIATAALVLVVIAIVTTSEIGGAAFLTSVAGLVAVSWLIRTIDHVMTVRSAQLREALITDPLTGLHNRRMLSSTLDAVLRDYQVSGLPSTVITVDIDRFETVNASYGHDYAKKVLVAIADTLHRNLRETDGVFRTGDKAFAVLLPEVVGQGSIIVMERLRNAVARIPLVENGGVTVSACIVQMETGDTSQTWIDRADRFVHQAKVHGSQPEIDLHPVATSVRDPRPDTETRPKPQPFTGEERRRAPVEGRNLARLSERLQSPERRREVLTQVERELEEVELQLFRFELQEPAG